MLLCYFSRINYAHAKNSIKNNYLMCFFSVVLNERARATHSEPEPPIASQSHPERVIDQSACVLK